MAVTGKKEKLFACLLALRFHYVTCATLNLYIYISDAVLNESIELQCDS